MTSLTRHQHKYQAEHTTPDRYLVVTHLPTGRTYSLNKRLQVNHCGRGLPDSPNVDEVPRIKFDGLPDARPDWAKGLADSEFKAEQLYSLLAPSGKQCRS